VHLNNQTRQMEPFYYSNTQQIGKRMIVYNKNHPKK